MSGRFIIGQFRPGDSFGHRLDPRAKIIFAIILMILSVLTTSWLFYLIVIFGVALMLLASGIDLGSLSRNFRPFIILISITALYHLIFSARETVTIINIFGFRLTEGGVYMALSFSLRVIVFIGIAFFITLTTSPSDMAETLILWMRPLKKIRVPVEDIGLIIFIAMRFIPVLAEEFDTIRKAQIIRGVDFSGNIFRRGRKMVYLLIPVFQSSIRRADDLAIAIESRGYVSGVPRSSCREFAFESRDWIFIFASSLVLITLFILNEYYGRLF